MILLTDHRCIALNATSLALGIVGNLFLLFNFTRRIRYIIALPASIILWFLATAIVRLGSGYLISSDDADYYLSSVGGGYLGDACV
jgi:VIT1/CCC1 family predicted Fe2+/Mn2+ transporter